MHDAVEVVAFPAQEAVERTPGQGTPPLVVRDQGIRIVRTDGMQAQEQEDQRVRHAREHERVPRGKKHDAQAQHQRIFQRPGRAVVRIDGQPRPDDGKHASQGDEVTAARVDHGSL